jgi:hypothetical protein
VPIKIVDPSGNTSAELPEDRSPVAATTPLVKSKPVEIPTKPISQPDTLEPVSTRFLNPASTTVGGSSSSEPTEPNLTTSPPQPSISTTKLSNLKSENFKDAKQARETVRPSRVGGGIFRATGQNTIFPTRELPAPENSVEPELQTASPSSPSSQVVPPLEEEVTPLGGTHKPPPTLFDFSKSWWTLTSPEKRWKLITVSHLLLNRDNLF